MTPPGFATADLATRRRIIEEALEKVLDRGPEMSVEPFLSGDPMHVWVIANPWTDSRTGHSLYDIACELEVLLV